MNLTHRVMNISATLILKFDGDLESGPFLSEMNRSY